MRKLFFLRHGVAYDREEWEGKNDEERPLTKDGIAAMKREAKMLRAMDLDIDRIISSPLVRAFDTARIASKKLVLDVEVNDLLKPGFNLSALQNLLGQLKDGKRILIVGHEPDFSNTIGALIGGGTIVLDKGGLARVDITSADPLRGELVWLLTPKWLKED
jgi:phosphohistidine phosphatase